MLFEYSQNNMQIGKFEYDYGNCKYENMKPEFHACILLAHCEE